MMRTLFHLLPMAQRFTSVMKNYKSKFSLLLLVAISTVLMFGCAKSETTTNRAATSTAPAASPAATATTASRTGEIGVPECDAYLKAYEACIHDKVPAAARTTFETSLANTKKAWHDQAANPQTRAALAAACKTAHDNAKTTMKAYNCTF
jgi:hypothetical protein